MFVRGVGPQSVSLQWQAGLVIVRYATPPWPHGLRDSAGTPYGCGSLSMSTPAARAPIRETADARLLGGIVALHSAQLGSENIRPSPSDLWPLLIVRSLPRPPCFALAMMTLDVFSLDIPLAGKSSSARICVGQEGRLRIPFPFSYAGRDDIFPTRSMFTYRYSTPQEFRLLLSFPRQSLFLRWCGPKDHAMMCESQPKGPLRGVGTCASAC